MKYPLSDLLDIHRLQSAMDSLYASSKIPSAIIDINGIIHAGSGWQDICTKFHRVHPDARKRCIESDLYISRHIHEANPSITYQCPHGLVDSATPIIIEGEHFGNVFTGQLFLEKPDLDTFRFQARTYGFDEGEYIDAVKKVPIITEQAMQENLAFIAHLTGMLAETGLERKREMEAEQRLGESEERYHELFENANDIIYTHDLAGNFTSINKAAERVTGYTLEEALKISFVSVLAPEYVDVARQMLSRKTTEGGQTRYELEIVCKNGRRVPLEVSTRIINRSGKPVGVQGIARDITERKQAEEALKESAERLVEAQKVARLGYYDLDVSTGAWTSSEILDDIFGVGDDYRRDVEGWSLLIHPEQRQPMVDYLFNNVLGKKEPFDREYRIVRESDKCVRWVHGLGKLEFDAANRPVKMIGTIQDITERKRTEEEKRKLEQQILQAQKLESLGVLAGGIAHDFNNLLMVVLGHAELALNEISPMSAARASLAEINIAARRAGDLCRQMLAYAGKASFALERVGPCELVEEMSHLLKSAISKKAILNLDLERSLPPIQADPSQIRQIVMNLIINASEAIGDRSGVINVAVGASRCDKEYLRGIELHDDLAPGRYVHLEVTDTGSGMDAETRSRIFEPFFTTKFAGRGLGLAAVLGIVRAHKGALKVFTEPGKGTTFKVLFPAVEDEGNGTSAKESSTLSGWRGRGTILLVDDEESLCALGTRMLEHLGFDVLTAADGLKAVELYRKRGREIDLVLMDLTMPHMDGAEAFGELRRLNPEVRVVLASGYSQDDVAGRFAEKGLDGVLQKPYTLVKLKESLAGLMPAQSAGAE